MKTPSTPLARRDFIKQSALAATGLIGLSGFAPVEETITTSAKDPLVVGPTEGYTPHLGILVSMLNYNRGTIINTLKGLTMEQLDHLHDPGANTIGSLALHLAATEKFYQINTFEGRQEYNEAEKAIWNAPMELGDQGRQKIKGHDVNYYLDILAEGRQKTLDEFKKKDDKWLLAIDPEWSKERPVNTYWKWFHVCEHESNHRGQMTWLKSRLPGVKPGKD
jgi:uncharacterized damage-inducible protein DinB